MFECPRNRVNFRDGHKRVAFISRINVALRSTKRGITRLQVLPNPASAGRTLESLRPPKPEQILPARSVVGEALLQFHPPRIGGRSTADRRTRSRSLRGPILAGTASARTDDDDDRLRLPPISSAPASAKRQSNSSM